MKNYWIIACLFLFVALGSQSVKAQEKNETQTLLGNGDTFENMGIMIAPSMEFSQMDGATAAIFNIRSGVLWNDRIGIGAFYQLSVNDMVPESETLDGIYMDYRAAGGFLEFTIMPERVFHVTLPVYFGAGEVQMDNLDGDNEPGLGEENFFMVQPNLLLEVNIHENVRFNLGAGYRFVGDMQYRNLNESDISGLSLIAGIKIGLFDL